MQHEDLRINIDAIVVFDYNDEDKVVIGDHVLDLGEPIDREQARGFVLWTRIARALHPSFEVATVNNIDIVTDFQQPVEDRMSRLVVDLSLDQMCVLLEIIEANREDAENHLEHVDADDDTVQFALDTLREVENELVAMVG